ncbi:sugar ABC transporter ATP-binding protein [Saccharopolyspora sp. WRP15-2]|uniref:Sugar ABC transporter ATP-binding protein n=1 Tax=Saccharopolyspora oryzae TaxID=2997343 RepID=A0ABT4V6F5_9PSEU|nr:sugar ABC transporter ATP-binding protein [Saccharopolyspora oryzae]MDA3629011.1 sugar ABC transporter ATP-binding protein [Saccharopolyspora oryzae]
MADTAVISLRGVRKTYRAVTALDGVDLEVLPGEVHCLAGENGAGKSTLIKILTGAETRDAGEYLVAGEPMRPVLTPSAARDAGVGVVYQELSLLPELTVSANLCMGRFPSRAGFRDLRRQREMATAMLSRVGLADLDPETRVAELPTATRQLVEIARVLGQNAKLVIFDEPTTALSEQEAAALLDRIRALRDEGVAVLYVSHRMEEMFAIGDRVTVLRDGRLVATEPMAEHTEDTLVHAMVGRNIESLYPGERAEPGDVRLELRGIRPVGFDEPVDLSVRSGEILGLAGLLGSGRSELLRAVFGADPVLAGQVLVDGQAVDTSSPRAAARSGIGLLTEDRKESGLMLGLSIEKNVAMASIGSVSSLGVLRRGKVRDHVSAAADGLRVKFGDWTDPVSSLSGGNQQKTLVARWRATGAKVLLLDEPTKGVDVGAKADIYRVIAELAAAGLAVVVVSSYLPELLGLCDRIAVVRQQRIAGYLDPAEATEEDVLHLASPVAAGAQETS